MSTDSPAPVTKVGAVILRGVETGAPQVFVVQPYGTKADIPAFVLPRGTRAYPAADGTLVDARDEATARAHADQLEDFTDTLAREIEEEAGMTPAQLAQSKVIELGVLPYESREKGIYPVQWYIVIPDVRTAAALANQDSVDSQKKGWSNLAEIENMAAAGTFKRGYIAVVKEALNRLQQLGAQGQQP